MAISASSATIVLSPGQYARLISSIEASNDKRPVKRQQNGTALFTASRQPNPNANFRAFTAVTHYRLNDSPQIASTSLATFRFHPAPPSRPKITPVARSTSN
jgi:hypothetical protein